MEAKDQTSNYNIELIKKKGNILDNKISTLEDRANNPTQKNNMHDKLMCAHNDKFRIDKNYKNPYKIDINIMTDI